MIPVVSLAFATGGVLENMQEEIIPLVPVLLILTKRLGFAPLTAVSMSAGAAFVGSAFSPINPFQVGIAQKLAELPLLSAGLFRIVFLAVALSIWIFATMRYAQRTRTAPEVPERPDGGDDPMGPHHLSILAMVAVTFAVLVWGILGRGWGFDEMSALFFIMGIAAGLVGGLHVMGTAEAYV